MTTRTTADLAGRLALALGLALLGEAAAVGAEPIGPVHVITIAGGGDEETRVEVKHLGREYRAREATFTPRLYAGWRKGLTRDVAPETAASVSGRIALANSTSSDPFDASHASHVKGLQDRGAAGVIVVSDGLPFTLYGESPDVTIPVVVIGKADSDELRSEIAAQGRVTVTLAGWDDGDGRPGIEATLDGPQGLALTCGGRELLIADQFHHRIRRLDLETGVIETVAGSSPGLTGGDGPAAKARFFYPLGLALDPATGTVFVGDRGRVRRIDDGVVTTIATDADWERLQDLELDSANGELYIGDYEGNRVQKLDLASGGLGLEGTFDSPFGLARDAIGNLYVAEQGGRQIQKIAAADSSISTIAGTGVGGGAEDGVAAIDATFRVLTDISFDPAGNLWISGFGLDNQRVRMIAAGENGLLDPTDLIFTVAGTSGGPGFGGEGGPALDARFNRPTNVLVDGADNVFIVDHVNGLIRLLTAAAVVHVSPDDEHARRVKALIRFKDAALGPGQIDFSTIAIEAFDGRSFVAAPGQPPTFVRKSGKIDKAKKVRAEDFGDEDGDGVADVVTVRFKAPANLLADPDVVLRVTGRLEGGRFFSGDFAVSD